MLDDPFNPLIQHGTPARFRSGCRCKLCVNRQKACRSKRRLIQLQRHLDMLAKDFNCVKHGSLSTYTNWGCRCVDCSEAMAAYSRRARLLAKGMR